MVNIKMAQRRVIHCGLAAVISMLLISWLNIRPLGIIFLILFCVWFYKTRCNFRILPPPELQKRYENFIECTCAWRQKHPTMFCAAASGCLGVLAVLGHLISGSTVVLTGLILAALASTKYNFKLVKIEHKDFDWSEKLNHDPELDDEFLPEVNESNLFVLERASNLATISSPTDDAEEDEKSDEVPSELLIPDAIPEIDETSSDDENLLPVVGNSGCSEGLRLDKTSDVIEFKKSHFKRDSSLSTTSSSSEESLSKGLKFPEYTAVDAPTSRQLLNAPTLPQHQEASDLVAIAVKSQTQALIANSSKLIPNLMSGLMQWGVGNSGSTTTSPTGTGVSTQAGPPQVQRRVVTALDSSDESDFEILENDDFK